jgi:hypothetical protein
MYSKQFFALFCNSNFRGQEKKLTAEEIVAKIETSFDETNDPDFPLVHPRVVASLSSLQARDVCIVAAVVLPSSFQVLSELRASMLPLLIAAAAVC